MADWHLTEKLYLAANEDVVLSLLKDWSKKIGFEDFGFASKYTIDFSNTNESRTYISHTYDSNNLIEYYDRLRQSDLAKLDARVQCSLLGIPSGAWHKNGSTSSAKLVEKFIPSAQMQLKLAGDFGIECGVTVPLHVRRSEWCFFSFTRYEKTDIVDLEHTVSEMSHAAQSVISVMDRLLFPANNQAKLTAREKEVLKWAAIGKTSWEISAILMISERTVNFHISEAAQKLGVRGRRAACTTAMAQGLIQFA